jgi:hypothetical protein
MSAGERPRLAAVAEAVTALETFGGVPQEMAGRLLPFWRGYAGLTEAERALVLAFFSNPDIGASV